jgi:hypothetical protein
VVLGKTRMTDRSTEGHAPRWSTPALASNEFPDVTLHNPIAALEDLVVVTRDTDEFVAAGVPAFDPWSSVLYAHGNETPVAAPASAEAVAEVILGMRRGR